MRDVVEKTSLGSLSNVKEGETQTFAPSDQLSHTNGGMKGQTFVSGVLIGQTGWVFVAGGSQGQSDRMDIDSQDWITELAEDEPENQAMARGLSDHRQVKSGAVQELSLLPHHNTDEEICLLKQRKAKAQTQKKLWKLCKEEARNFSSDKDLARPLGQRTMFRDQIAMKRARRASDPILYTRKSQQAFDIYIKEINHTFTTQPMIYSFKKLKCMYVGQFLDGILLKDWDNYQSRIGEMEELE